MITRWRDGESIVVTGILEGQSDLYLYNLETREVRQLTNDHYSDMQPNWSPDGSRIVFSTDRANNSSSASNKGLRLAILSLSDNSISLLSLFPKADNMNPLFSPNQQSLYFLSNRDAFRNLYRYSLVSGDTYQLTDYFTGISGISAFSPALSIAGKDGTLTYSYYLDSKYSIYRAQLNDFDQVRVDPDSVNFAPAILPIARKSSFNTVDANLKTPESFEPLPEDSIYQSPYEPNFRLTYISNTAGVGISTGQFGTGLAGGVNMLFSDILGDHKLFGAAMLNGEIYGFGGQVGYLNQKRKIDWGIVGGHIPIVIRGCWPVMIPCIMVKIPFLLEIL